MIKFGSELQATIRECIKERGVQAILAVLDANLQEMVSWLVTKDDDVLRGHIQALQGLYEGISGVKYQFGMGSNVGLRENPAPALHKPETRIPSLC